MLCFLHIRDFAIVRSMELEFDAGFTCITGETGAGKSILVGALGLLTGQRADVSLVRAGAERADLSAGFELEKDSTALNWLTETELADGNSCLLRRSIHANGRSRAWINGQPVTLAQLAELGQSLVEIHGQNEHLRLLQKTEQLHLLDAFHAKVDALETTVEAFEQWQDLARERQQLQEATPLDAGDLKLMEYQIEELQQHPMTAEEFRELENEHRRLAHGDETRAQLDSGMHLLDGDEGALHQLHAVCRQLEPIANGDAELQTTLTLLNEAVINAEEARAALQDFSSRLDLSPERLQQLERSLSQQHDLARKHRAEPGQLEAVLQRLQQRLEEAGSRDQRIQVLDQEIEKALVHYRKTAAKLGKLRQTAAKDLSAQVSALMQDLGLQGGVFEISVDHQAETTPSRSGSDQVQYRVSANAGTAPGALGKVASGGELSRISLAIKVAAQRDRSLSVQVFDEVDAGIGGETASTVGSLIRSLAASGQALCVTHLAQVAVFADRQLSISKQAAEDKTEVSSRVLNPDARVDEVARMLGGTVSEQSRAHASELLDTAHTRH